MSEIKIGYEFQKQLDHLSPHQINVTIGEDLPLKKGDKIQIYLAEGEVKLFRK